MHVGQNQHNPIMAVKAAKKTQNPKKTQSAKKTPTPKKSTSPKKAQTKKDKEVVKNKKPNPVKDVVPSETPETTEISETPQDSTINTTSVKVDTTKESPKRTKRTLEDLVGSENIITTCELAEEQVRLSVSSSYSFLTVFTFRLSKQLVQHSKLMKYHRKKLKIRTSLMMNLNLLISSFQPSKSHKESQFSFPRNFSSSSYSSIL